MKSARSQYAINKFFLWFWIKNQIDFCFWCCLTRKSIMEEMVKNPSIQPSSFFKIFTKFSCGIRLPAIPKTTC